MASSPTKPFYKDATFEQQTGLGIAETISNHTQSLDIAKQTRAPLNWRDRRDFSDYRHSLIKTKDEVLKTFRLTKDPRLQVRTVLLYRNLQRYQKVNPVPITPQGYAMRHYLDERINNAIVDEPLAIAHKGYFDDIFRLHYYVLDLAQRLAIPSFHFKERAAYHPSFDRFKTLTREKKLLQQLHAFSPRIAIRYLLSKDTILSEINYNYNPMELSIDEWYQRGENYIAKTPRLSKKLEKVEKVKLDKMKLRELVQKKTPQQYDTATQLRQAAAAAAHENGQ